MHVMALAIEMHKCIENSAKHRVSDVAVPSSLLNFRVFILIRFIVSPNSMTVL